MHFIYMYSSQTPGEPFGIMIGTLRRLQKIFFKSTDFKNRRYREYSRGKMKNEDAIQIQIDVFLEVLKQIRDLTLVLSEVFLLRLVNTIAVYLLRNTYASLLLYMLQLQPTIMLLIKVLNLATKFSTKFSIIQILFTAVLYHAVPAFA